MSPVIVQVVKNGVAVNGAVMGSASNNTLLYLLMNNIIPSSGSTSSYKIGFSGSQYEDSVSVNTIYSGSNYGQDVVTQWQNFPVFSAGKNLKGNVQPIIQEFGTEGGLVTLLPDSIIVSTDNLNNNLTPNTLFLVLNTNGGGIFGWNSPSTNVWLWYYPLSVLPS